jgi:2-aminoethylphosphonate-pyruvate transaminase
MKTVPRAVLLNPGPATTSDAVKWAQVVTDICPREKDFGKLMRDITVELTRFVADPDRYTTVLFGGSGTAVMESMLVSVCTGGKVVIVDNGAYGRRLVQIAQAHGLDHVSFVSSPFEPVDLEALEAAIVGAGGVTHLAVIHHETTTGLLNDLGPLGSLTRKLKLTFLVDGISSYAGMPIDLERDNVSFMTASSNKNIQGMAGVGFILCRKTDLLALKGKKTGLYYLDLFPQWENFEKTGQTRFTPPVQTLYALWQAIVETQAETVPKRYERYTASWQTLLRGLDRLGLKTLVAREHQSHLITTIVEPVHAAYSFDAMHDWCFARGFTIYPGKVGDKNTFRIANIGQIDSTDIEAFLKVLGEYLKTLT